MNYHVKLANGHELSFNEVLGFYKKYVSFECVEGGSEPKVRRYFGCCIDVSLSVAKQDYCAITINLPHLDVNGQSFLFNNLKSIQLVDVAKHDDTMKD